MNEVNHLSEELGDLYYFNERLEDNLNLQDAMRLYQDYRKNHPIPLNDKIYLDKKRRSTIFKKLKRKFNPITGLEKFL